MASKSFDLDKFLMKEISSRAQVIDQSVSEMRRMVLKLASKLRLANTSKTLLLSAKDLEKCYSASAAFAFTLAQHFASIERLSVSLDWQKRNSSSWKKLRSAEKLCGVATTHLAKPGPPILWGEKIDGGYRVSGYAPWSCGFQIFEELVLGFVAGEDIVFACIEYPKKKSQPHLKVLPNKLVCLNGSSSVGMRFDDYFVSDVSIISLRSKAQPVKVAPSRYIGCEKGIGKSALKLVSQTVKESKHPKNIFLKKAHASLSKEYKKISKLKSSELMNPESQFKISEFNRHAVRLASLSLGAQSLLVEGSVGRWSLELLLFDAVIQSPLSLQMKINQIG